MRLTLVLSVLVASAQLTHGLRSLRALTTTYPRCTASQTKTFKDNLNKATRDCASVSSYVWDGNDDPNDEQRAGICQCMMTPLSVPKCSWLKETSYPVSVLEHVTFVYNCAKTSGYPLPTVTEVELASYTSTSTTTAPAATTASPTPTTASPTPTTSKSSSSSSTSSTPAPTATTTAPDCTVQQLTAFTTALNTASSGCTTGTTYNWGGSADPTNAQYAELCKCTSASTFTIPNCSVSKSGYVVTLETHYNWVITQQCGTYSPSAAGSTTETTTTTDEKKSSSSIGMIAGIAGGVVVVVLIIGFVMCKRKGKGKQDETQAHVATNNTTQSPAPYQPMATTPAVEKTYNMHAEARPSGVSSQGTRTTISTQNGSVRPSAAGSLGSSSASVRMTETATWDDPAIVAARIPHDDIFFGTLLSRGGFGEVFRGTYKGETVAIKQLLPARRKDLEQISDFLGEVKLMSTLEHDRIVKFIGVAWNSLSDACMVVEYMENGDLRSVLTRWDEGAEKRVNGFDADKVKIALHVAHALLYLHSLQPVVVHRDLKSKNILLDGNMDAKLTDFGISRERADATMTAGVGSSLWMAPEVMMGNRYDEKADIFSFGVVLSELDTHQQPYFHARETETGQKVPETAILQQVMLGRVSVGFTDRADPDLVQLGRECVSLDPRERPTTAQLLHRVNQIMRQYK